MQGRCSSMRGSTWSLKWRQLAAVRFIYFFAVATVKLFSLYQFWMKIAPLAPTRSNLATFRAAMGVKCGRITDRMFDLGKCLLISPVKLGENAASVRLSRLLETPMVPRVDFLSFDKHKCKTTLKACGNLPNAFVLRPHNRPCIHIDMIAGFISRVDKKFHRIVPHLFWIILFGLRLKLRFG